MIYYFVKIIISAISIVIISEIAKRSSFIGGLIASIPLISLLAFFWLYIETKEPSKIIDLSYAIFWLVIPSLVLFLILPELLKYGLNFYISILLSIILTIICYWFMIIILGFMGIKL